MSLTALASATAETLQTAVNVLGFPIGANETEVCAGPVAMILPLDVHVQKSGIIVERLAAAGLAPIGRGGVPIETSRDGIPQPPHVLQRD